MRALCWHAKNDIRCETVADPGIDDPTDVIVKVTSCAICGSDLHLMDGQMPTMERGDVLGHEFMGEVVEIGGGARTLAKGDRVIVPFQITCGECHHCKAGNYASCARSNRNADMAAKQFGYPTAGLYGYSHLTGGYAGGQAEYVQVKMADTSVVKVPEGFSDEQALFLTDILPTGWQAAAHCELKGGETVAIWGAGPVGLFAIKAASVMGAARIISIEPAGARQSLARLAGATDVIDPEQDDVHERIKEITRGSGPDAAIDCVGMEASGHHGALGLVSRVQAAVTSTQRPYALEQAIYCARPSSIVSVPGVYGGPVPVNMGSVVQKGLTIRSGQTHVRRWVDELIGHVEAGRIDPTFLITHRSEKLEDGPALYETFRDKKDSCVKVVFHL